MPNALIFSAGFDGHRQVYVFVLSYLLKELKYSIFIAGNLKGKITNSLYIDKLKEDKYITFIDTSLYEGNGLKIKAREILELQNKFGIQLTVFAEADHHISLFTSQIFNSNNRLNGKKVGIFLRPFYYYDKPSLLEELRYVKNLMKQWPSNPRLFHGLLLKQYKLLDAALYIDENFVSHHSFTRWLPDVFQQFAETLVKDEYIEQRIWIDILNDFIVKNDGRFIFLYFGTSQRRRGYDLLLKMAVEQNACFIHCGLYDRNENYIYEVDKFREVLYKTNRILETNTYISDPVCIEYFFKVVSHLVLPYRDFYGSSGIMLQALNYGIPVLVPENGIMGYRVKKHHLGLTYKGDDRSLAEQFSKFKAIPKSSFSDSIKRYMRYQSIDKLKEVLIENLKV